MKFIYPPIVDGIRRNSGAEVQHSVFANPWLTRDENLAKFKDKNTLYAISAGNTPKAPKAIKVGKASNGANRLKQHMSDIGSITIHYAAPFPYRNPNTLMGEQPVATAERILKKEMKQNAQYARLEHTGGVAATRGTEWFQAKGRGNVLVALGKSITAMENELSPSKTKGAIQPKRKIKRGRTAANEWWIAEVRDVEAAPVHSQPKQTKRKASAPPPSTTKRARASPREKRPPTPFWEVQPATAKRRRS